MKNINQRFVFIENIVGWEGQINATHIMEKFHLTRQAASTILKDYRRHFEGCLDYDSSSKAFIATSEFDRRFLKNISPT